MSKFKVGQRVRVELVGTVEDTNNHDGCLLIESTNGYNHYVYDRDSSVKITDADPENWPPQVGDIWQADGLEYVVRENRSTSAYTVIESLNAHPNRYYSSRLDEFKALNPTLVRRR